MLASLWSNLLEGAVTYMLWFCSRRRWQWWTKQWCPKMTTEEDKVHWASKVYCSFQWNIASLQKQSYINGWMPNSYLQCSSCFNICQKALPYDHVYYYHYCVSTNPLSASIIWEGLIDNLATALTLTSLRKLCQQLLETDCFSPKEWQESNKQDSEMASSDDYTLKDVNLTILGRLYYSTILAAKPYLEEVGLIPDHCGFTVLLALCRAASASAAVVYDNHSSSWQNIFTHEGSKLDAALSSHFNGINI